MAKADSAVPSLAFERLCSDAEHMCCAAANVAVLMSLSTPSVAYMERATSAIVGLSKQHTRGIALVNLLARSVTPPDEAQRLAMMKALRSMQDVVRGSVFVVEGQGFRA